MGTVEPVEREAWTVLEREGRHTAAQLCTALRQDPAEMDAVLHALCRRRLAMPLEDGYEAVGASLLAGRLQ
jgi:hypothetical protein